jgi:orotate phosphoribosyltransferase
VTAEVDPRALAVDEALYWSDAYQGGHTVLNSGLHTIDRIVADRLLDYPQGLRLVQHNLAQAVFTISGMLTWVTVPIPEGMPNILRGWQLEGNTVYARKQGVREFGFTEEQERKIADVQAVVVTEDVVSTGGVAAAMADKLLKINPDLQLSLVGIVLRGTVLPEHAASFQQQEFLLHKPLSAWAAQDCPSCQTAMVVPGGE